MPILGHFLKFETNTSVFPRTSRSRFTAKRERSAIVTARYDRRHWIRSKPKSSSILCNLPRALGAYANYWQTRRKLSSKTLYGVFFYAQTACKITLRENPLRRQNRLRKRKYAPLPHDRTRKRRNAFGNLWKNSNLSKLNGNWNKWKCRFLEMGYGK